MHVALKNYRGQASPYEDGDCFPPQLPAIDERLHTQLYILELGNPLFI